MSAAVLQISPFVVPAAPVTGGQIRVAEFAQAYRAAGYRVDRVVVHSGPSGEATALDVCLRGWDKRRRKHLGRPSGLGHLRQMWGLEANPVYARELAARLPCRYDLIQVEHPWDFGLAWHLREQPGQAGARIAYSSHNLEAGLQEMIWRANGQWNGAAQRLVREIEAHEAHVARRADVCWATSASDLAGLLQRGARTGRVVPNGVVEIAPEQPGAKVPTSPYLLFVGSSHVPNVEGWREWLAAPLSDVPTAGRIVLAGSVGRAVARDAAYAADFAAGRLIDAGIVERAHLDQLIRHAHAIVLPISSGGGTNLKTAEALVSGRPIIATPVSMRGFEAFASQGGVRVASTPQEFRRLAWECLQAPRQATTDNPATRKLLWLHAFDEVWPALRELGLPPANR